MPRRAGPPARRRAFLRMALEPRRGVVKLRVRTSLATFVQQYNALQASGKPIAYRVKGKLFIPLRPDGIAFDRQGEVVLP